MSRNALAFALLVPLLLAGCSSEGARQDDAPLDQTPVLTGQGISLGSTPVPFGTPAAAAEDALRRAWGDPDNASDWGPPTVEWGYCGGTTLRTLTWGDVHVLFSDVDGAPELTGWRWDGPAGPEAVGVGRDFSSQGPLIYLGDTVTRAQEAYPSAYVPAVRRGGDYGFFLPHAKMVRDTPLLESGVSGVATDPSPDGTILLLEAGSLCDF